jgi:hypothetical protein
MTLEIKSLKVLGLNRFLDEVFYLQMYCSKLMPELQVSNYQLLANMSKTKTVRNRTVFVRFWTLRLLRNGFRKDNFRYKLNR